MRIVRAFVAFVVGLVVLAVVDVSPARAAVPGLQIVSAVTVADSVSPKSAVATCPAGKRVIGTGVYLDGVAGDVVVDDLVPTTSSVVATGYERGGGTAAVWWIRAFAVCAAPLPGLTIVTTTTAATSSHKTVSAACPTGTQVLGAGAAVTGGLGGVTLDALWPDTASVTAAAFEDAFATTVDWTLTTHAICAQAPPGLVRVTAGVVGATTAATSPVCPAGTATLGLGWDISSRYGGRILVEGAMPTAGGAHVGARATDTAVAPGWVLAARAVCAVP
jgi:hypothetical protein